MPMTMIDDDGRHDHLHQRDEVPDTVCSWAAIIVALCSARIRPRRDRPFRSRSKRVTFPVHGGLSVIAAIRATGPRPLRARFCVIASCEQPAAAGRRARSLPADAESLLLGQASDNGQYRCCRKEQNDLLTQTGPGTPMGQLFRCYWLPALLAEELPENDCPPVRVKILSERLLAFRDSDGKLRPDRRILRPSRRLAVVRPQRGRRAALPLSRLEIRRDRPMRRRAVRAGRERLLQEDQAHVLPAGEARRGAVGLYGPARQDSRRCRNGNSPWCRRSRPSSRSGCRNATGCRPWKAASIPATSRSCIAATCIPIRCSRAPRATSTISHDMQPHFEVVEQPGGLFIGARRNAENGNYYWRITPWVMPCFTMIPPRGDHPMHGHFWVPIDDENCWAWSYDFHPVRALTKTEVDAMKDGAGVHCKYDARHVPAARQQGQRLSDRSRGAEGRQDVSAASPASPCRMRRCRKAWGRSAIAPRKIWSRPTTASSWRGIA